MTLELVPRDARTHDWTITLVAADMDYKLAAEYLKVSEFDVLKWSVLYADEIAEVTQAFARIEFWKRFREELPDMKEATIADLAKAFSGQQNVTVNNPQQNNFNFDTSPRERLEAELDGIARRATSNGHHASE